MLTKYLLIKGFVCSKSFSDESEPSWLEPELELKDFQLGSTRLVTFYPSARNQKSDKNEPKNDFDLIFDFSFFFLSM